MRGASLSFYSSDLLKALRSFLYIPGSSQSPRKRMHVQSRVAFHVVVNEVAADESGAAGDDGGHGLKSLIVWCLQGYLI